MRVAYLLDRYPVLTQTFVRLEIEELLRQGVDVEVYALRAGDEVQLGEPPVTVVRDLPGDKVGHAVAHLRWAVRSPARYLAFLRAVRAVASERRDVPFRRLPALADVLTERGTDHLHAHFGWSGAAAAWCLAELTGRPWSMTVHGNDLFAQTRNLEPKLAAADHVVTVCEYNRRWLLERHALDPSIIVCGVEVPSDDQLATEAAIDVVLVGRLVAKKGVDLLLAAAAILPDVSFEIIGDGPLRPELETAAPPNVSFVGALPHREVLDRIARARLLCLPARVASDGDRDSMPLVVKEAMARRVPVVVSDAVGLPELVDETCGWVVPAEDDGALTASLRSALADPAERARRADAGRRRVAEGFTLAGEVAKLRALFETGEPAAVG